MCCGNARCVFGPLDVLGAFWATDVLAVLLTRGLASSSQKLHLKTNHTVVHLVQSLCRSLSWLRANVPDDTVILLRTVVYKINIACPRRSISATSTTPARLHPSRATRGAESVHGLFDQIAAHQQLVEDIAGFGQRRRLRLLILGTARGRRSRWETPEGGSHPRRHTEGTPGEGGWRRRLAASRVRGRAGSLSRGHPSWHLQPQ